MGHKKGYPERVAFKHVQSEHDQITKKIQRTPALFEFCGMPVPLVILKSTALVSEKMRGPMTTLSIN